MTLHDEADCPHCQDCPGCEGGSLFEGIANPIVTRARGGAVTIRCGDCWGEGLICDCDCHIVHVGG